MLATISIDVGIKVIILKPILFSLAFSKAAGELLYDSTFKQKSVPKIPKLYFQVLKDITGMDFKEITRANRQRKLWDELSDLQDKRNKVLHQAKPIFEHDAEESISIADAVFDEIIPKILNKFHFHLKGEQICYRTS